MKMIHSYWAYLVLIILIIAAINALMGLTSKREFKDKDLRISLFALIVMHIQLLIGLGWYFMSPAYHSLKEIGVDTTNRLLAVEHPAMMILAIILVTVGWSTHKKQTTDEGKFKKIAIFYGVALLLVLSRIPWSQWLNL